MSSPGSGKTTTLMRTIEALKDELNIAVMEADIDSDVDARTILDTGVRAIQLHTGGMCHLDAYMTEQGSGRAGAGVPRRPPTPMLWLAMPSRRVPSAPLVPRTKRPWRAPLCPLRRRARAIRRGRPSTWRSSRTWATSCVPPEFDTGASANAMILSVPEGDDKPLKYPLMFSICDVVLVNKIDALPVFDTFSMKRVRENILMRNPNATIIPISAKTGEGIDEWTDWLRAQVAAWKASA